MGDSENKPANPDSGPVVGAPEWAAASWTATLTGGLFAAFVVVVNGMTDGSVAATVVAATSVGSALMAGGGYATRHTATPKSKHIGFAVICAVAVVAAVYGLSAAA